MTARSVPVGFAALLQLLELEQPQVLTTAQIGDLVLRAGLSVRVDVAIRRLRERGWLLPLATRGVWEFAPAARAGAFGSGDPFVELRAVLARDPGAPFAVAAESAAFLHGLASRRPDTECIGAPAPVRPPKSLDTYRMVRWTPAVPLERRNGLPVWSLVTLVAFMAVRPSGYHDWRNVGEWIREAAAVVQPDSLAAELEGHSAASWARAGYLLAIGGAAESALSLTAAGPTGSGPFYLGDRTMVGRYDRRFDVVDSSGMEVGGQ